MNRAWHISWALRIFFDRSERSIAMQTLTQLLLKASGADLSLLKQCPGEKSKYAGIGATILFTGIFAALAAAYALFTVFDSYWIASGLGLLWGLMIFNLDRYIVSSMRKEGKPGKEFLTALPRIALALIISLVIAKPLELKIFEKEIEPQLVILEQQTYGAQEAETRSRFAPTLSGVRHEIAQLKQEIESKTRQRDALAQKAQQEADGTGGSRVKNIGPIYKIKKADADQADAELATIIQTNTNRIRILETELRVEEMNMNSSVAELSHTDINGPAARMEALSQLTEKSDAIGWAHVFILLLFFMLETTPILVKLISRSGPYDALLHMAEHGYRCKEVESIATANSETKKRTAGLSQEEQAYVLRKLNAELL
jgi:hypothetical protein